MKEWKTEIINYVAKDPRNHAIWPFKAVMEDFNLKHIKREDAQDIVRAVIKQAENKAFGLRGYIYVSGKPFVSGFFTSYRHGVIEISAIEADLIHQINSLY